MRGRGAILAALLAVLALPAAAQPAQQAPASPQPPLVVGTPGDAPERDYPPIMTIDQEQLFMGSLWGQRAVAEIDRRYREIEAENERLASQYATEEQELTTLRATLPPDEFRARADEFDKRVVAVRRERDKVGHDLETQMQQERSNFLRAALPVLAQVMKERGAVVVLDQSAIFVSAQSVDVTALLIQRINKDIGAGTAPVVPDPGTAPVAPDPGAGQAPAPSGGPTP